MVMQTYQVRTADFDVEANSPEEAAKQVANMLVGGGDGGYALRAVYIVTKDAEEEGFEIDLGESFPD
jgi:hypothetical protein